MEEGKRGRGRDEREGGGRGTKDSCVVSMKTNLYVEDVSLYNVIIFLMKGITHLVIFTNLSRKAS